MATKITGTPTLEQLETELKKELYKNTYGKVLRSTVFALLVVAAAAVLIAMMVFPVYQLRGSSMAETLNDGDIVVAVKGASYKAGNIIAFYYNNNLLVKRVIATSGDWVDIDEAGTVFVNGEALQEPYVSRQERGECEIEFPYQVPEGRCFVLGDHREVSIDSRNKSIGCISNELVEGRIILRVWPLSGKKIF